MNGSFKKLFSRIREGIAYKQEQAKLEVTLQIESLMKRNGINKAELARIIRKKPPYITKIMKGESNLTIESMVSIADAVGGKVEIHITPKEEEIIAWYKSIKTTGSRMAKHRKLLVIESNEAERVQDDPSLEYFRGTDNNGYSVAA